MRVGGKVDVWVEPASEPDLIAALQFTGERQLPVMMLGRGSNLLVRDGGIRGLVICLSQPHFSRVEQEGNRLRCGAGSGACPVWSFSKAFPAVWAVRCG